VDETVLVVAPVMSLAADYGSILDQTSRDILIETLRNSAANRPH
jgi:hypothetical protein